MALRIETGQSALWPPDARPGHVRQRPAGMAFVGTYPPRACGIASFTRDLRAAVSPVWAGELPVIALDRATQSDPESYPVEVVLRIRQTDTNRTRIRDRVASHNVGIVSVQHEFGIYGGSAGRDVLDLVAALDRPTITTLHTLPLEPTMEQARILAELADASAHIVVMSDRGRQLAVDRYGMDPVGVRVIPHGVPDLPLLPTEPAKVALGVSGDAVILSYGLISPNKGLGAPIAAMADIVRQIPEARLVIAGATHPEVARQHGEAYRRSLEESARSLGIAHRVTFIDRYLTAAELRTWMLAADVFVTPFGDSAQITSGTLAYAVASGRAVVSTPFEHARELLADARGALVPFHDPQALAGAIVALLADDEARLRMRRRAWTYGRRMVWPAVGQAYADLAAALLGSRELMATR